MTTFAYRAQVPEETHLLTITFQEPQKHNTAVIMTLTKAVPSLHYGVNFFTARFDLARTREHARIRKNGHVREDEKSTKKEQ